MGTRILLTGATGRVGRALLRRLAAADARPEVVAGTRNPDRAGRSDAPAARWVHLDYTRADTARAALSGVRRLFLVTGYTSAMVDQSKTVLDAAKKAGVQHVVHLGALGSDAANYPHLAWHGEVERYIEALGFGFTHLQPKNFMQNIFMSLHAGSGEIRHFLGDARVSWIDVDDIASIAAAALMDPERHDGQTYPLATEAASMHEVAAILTRETGRPIRQKSRDPEGLAAILMRGGMEAGYANSLATAISDTCHGRFPGADRVHDTVDRLCGRPATRWADFARRHRACIQARLDAVGAG